jgi:hypothetical protein
LQIQRGGGSTSSSGTLAVYCSSAQDSTMRRPPISTNSTLSATVTIEATFGSEIQRDVSVKVLREFLDAWKQNVESSHKRNRIRIDYVPSQLAKFERPN